MKTSVSHTGDRDSPHCPCCHDRVHATDLVCNHCGMDLASGAHSDGKRHAYIGVVANERDEEERPHGFWPMMTAALVLMVFAFFIFPPAAFLMLGIAGLYQTSRMPVR